MEFKQAALSRKSTRDYTDEPVSEADLREIVEIAGRAASWCNAQPWKVYAMTGDTLGRVRAAWGERLAAEAEGAQEIEGVHREDMTEAAAANMDGFFGAATPLFQAGVFAPQVLYNAPVALILTVPAGASQYAMYDLGAFAEQLMLAATDKGIQSIPAAMFVQYPDVLRAELPIAQDEAIAVGIGLGHASDAETNSFATPRMAVDDYLTICG